MSKKSNKIVKNKASRGQVEDIEMAEQVATQSILEESEAKFFRDYVAKQIGCLVEIQYCCSFHSELLQKHSKEPPASYPLINHHIWSRAQGPIPPTIFTPGFFFNVKCRDNKKSGGVVEDPEILDEYAIGAEIERRSFKAKPQLPDFRKIRPDLFHRSLTKPQHFKPMPCRIKCQGHAIVARKTRK